MTFNQIYSRSVSDYVRRIRSEMEVLGYERDLLEEWKVLDPLPIMRNSLIAFDDDEFQGDDFIDELSDQEI